MIPHTDTLKAAITTYRRTISTKLHANVRVTPAALEMKPANLPVNEPKSRSYVGRSVGYGRAGSRHDTALIQILRRFIARFVKAQSRRFGPHPLGQIRRPPFAPRRQVLAPASRLPR